jgi:hypothetical protein
MLLAANLSPKGCVLNGVETMSCVHGDRTPLLPAILAYMPRSCVHCHHNLGAGLDFSLITVVCKNVGTYGSQL